MSMFFGLDVAYTCVPHGFLEKERRSLNRSLFPGILYEASCRLHRGCLASLGCVRMASAAECCPHQ